MTAILDTPMPRRSFVLGAGLAGAALALPQDAAAALRANLQGEPLPALRLEDPQENLRLYVRMNGDLSGKPYASWYCG